jgi:hypothetical protein
VQLTATNAQFVYNYGDFRGKPEQVLDRCFDLMVYVANFGVRQLMFRLPKALLDSTIFEPYCVEDFISIETTPRSLILNIQIVRKDYYGWLEEEEYLADLVPLREDLLKGDLRVLYLAWLAAGFAEENTHAPEESIEPPVPANLKKLSPALKGFAELFQVDQDLITAAAEASAVVQSQTVPDRDCSPVFAMCNSEIFLIWHGSLLLMRSPLPCAPLPLPHSLLRRERSLTHFGVVLTYGLDNGFSQVGIGFGKGRPTGR